MDDRIGDPVAGSVEVVVNLPFDLIALLMSWSSNTGASIEDVVLAALWVVAESEVELS